MRDLPWPYLKHNLDSPCECRGCNDVNVLIAAERALTGGVR